MPLTIKRTSFIKDLLSFNSLCKKGDVFEFDSFSSFKKGFLNSNTDLFLSKKWIINGISLNDLSFFKDYNIQNDIIIFKLRSISIDILEAISLLNLKDICILMSKEDAQNFIEYEYRESLEKYNQFFFKNQNIKGIIELSVSSKEEIDTLFKNTFKFFYILPFFQYILIDWDWCYLESLRLKDLSSLEVQITWIKENLQKSRQEWVINDEKYPSKLEILNNLFGYKKIYLTEDFMYLENPFFEESKVEIYKNINAEILSEPEIDSIRSFYDIEFQEGNPIRNLGLISIFQNFKLKGSPALLPYSCRFVDSIIHTK